MTNPYRGLTKENFNTVRDILTRGLESKSYQEVVAQLKSYMSEDEAKDLVQEEYMGMFGWQKN